MTRKMLIDAAHPEETRVVVLKDNKVEEFDYESSTRNQIRGNIYLAKVTRIEPSLQAAFVDYGGNRHGFLAFNEIHPDYYQIPVADREALLEAEAELQKTLEDHEKDVDKELTQKASDESAADGDGPGNGEVAATGHHDIGDTDGDTQAIAELRRLRRQKLRSYKIQEVIKRRQIILVQVAKEERGNKGAALTTYLSLAGRYCVLMPNTARGGGISRKISNPSDRKKLRKIVESLDVPAGMGLIIRTAGAKRTKAEIRRDYDYLLRLWENVRSLTLESMAPSLVYEEGNLVKRAIRDLYNKDIDTVLVEGEEAYKEAKNFMRMLTPSHAKNVKQFKEDVSILQRYQVEPQLDEMYQPQVQLKSGGYIVINPTEALVAIDVNSGKATRERNIESTALQTNLEAAEEVARQCRLRDLAGLIVIDFIDMDENRNDRAVERRLKEAMRRDRARVQIGRISGFGLLEMSRQRMRSGVLEGTSVPCTICKGTGSVRSLPSTALRILRLVEEQAIKAKGGVIEVRVPVATALYLLNDKRAQIRAIEEHLGVTVLVEADSALLADQFEIIKGKIKPADVPVAERVASLESAVADTDEMRAGGSDSSDSDSGESKPKRRRRRRQRRGKQADQRDEAAATEEADEPNETEGADARGDGDDGEPQERRKSRRRGRRGGRRHEKRRGEREETGKEKGTPSQHDAAPEHSEGEARAEVPPDAGDMPSQDAGAEGNGHDHAAEQAEAMPVDPPQNEAADTEPTRSEEDDADWGARDETEPAEDREPAKPAGPARRGWWQRRSP